MTTLEEAKAEWAEEERKAERWKSIKPLRSAMLKIRKILLLNKKPLGRYEVSKREYYIIVEFIGKPKLFGFEIYYDE